MKYALLLSALVAGSASAGNADVRFVEPEHWRDAGPTPIEIKRTEDALRQHVERLAKQLPDGQTLTVELLDVDLAGTVQYNSPRQIRIAVGGADPPRIKLRYTVEAGGRTLKSGDADLEDLDYFSTTIGRRSSPQAYDLETRLLDRWFERELAVPH